jgi:hypothetical protein
LPNKPHVMSAILAHLGANLGFTQGLRGANEGGADHVWKCVHNTIVTIVKFAVTRVTAW